jgi:hypothetical protein|tara:strand:- start:999 stop:1748 length:750 start_codon:yes stop_codon:yes gene_type:complete
MKGMGYRTLPSYAQSEGARWVAGPLGPYLAHRGTKKQAHLGLSYDQWLSVVVHRQRFGGAPVPGATEIIEDRYPAYARALYGQGGYGNFSGGFDGWGGMADELDGYGDVCTRTEKRYKKLQAKIKRKKKKFKKRGRRFLWIKTGSGKKWVRNKTRKLKKIKAKARSKSCVWTGRKRRKKKIKELKQQEKALEKKLELETKETSAALERATQQAIEAQSVESQQPGSNPFLILGVVAGLGLIMVAIAKKK